MLPLLEGRGTGSLIRMRDDLPCLDVLETPATVNRAFSQPCKTYTPNLKS